MRGLTPVAAGRRLAIFVRRRMPNIRVTAEAAAELRKRIDSGGLPNSFVAIFRDMKQADLSRGPKGEAVWTIEPPPNRWRCEVFAVPEEVLAMPGYEPWPLFDVDGVAFAIPGHELDGLDAIEVAIVDGNLHVRVPDA